MLYYASVTGSYACTQCGCSMTAPTCEPTSSFYTDPSCESGHTVDLPHDDSTCAQLVSGETAVQITSNGSPSGGQCAPNGTGGTLTGSPSYGSPFTVCCGN
jgi:hypothetical protein